IGSIVMLGGLGGVIAVLLRRVVNSRLIGIGDIMESSRNRNGIMMGMILGGIMRVVGRGGLSSMGLRGLLGLRGVAMGIGGMGGFSWGFMNGRVLDGLKLGDGKCRIAVSIEGL
ncbi:PTS sugar transporter subunit IIC, partial [Staphylococcus aureus]|uniref:PTS sugar transporter subunit IIC n=1 Tax=Staphylococcus aureus TaxID=1280 RepID=UPI0021B3518F